jgi:DNA-binding NarL/FixJ family response regulator
MPDFEPVAFVRQARQRHPALKILVVSAYDDQSYVVGLLSAGVNGYHLKEQPLSDLQQAVQRILEGGRWISDPLVDRLIGYQAAASSQAHPVSLTRRQRQLLFMLTQGYNNHKIAALMDLSVKTVENHLTALYRAIGVESRLEANHYASLHPELLAALKSDLPAGESLPGAPEAFSVLLLDNNSRYRAQLGKMVGRTSPAAVIYEAEDSTEALRLAQQVNPRLAFIDVVLEGEDGITCARRIHTAAPATRIILISAYPDREFRRLGISAGAVAFLDKKDIDAATVRQLVEDALNS